MEIINYRDVLANTQQHWLSQTVALINNNTVRIRTINKATAEWHSHDSGDDFFMVLEGEVFIDTIENNFLLKEKEFLVIPAGTQHRARSEAICTLLVIDNFQ